MDGLCCLSLFFLIMIFFIVVPIAMVTLRVVKESEKGIIERYGKYLKTENPGLVILIPFVDKFTLVDLKEKILHFQKIDIRSYDGKKVEVNGSILFEIIDPLKATYEVKDLDSALEMYCINFIRDEINSLQAYELTNKRKDLNLKLENIAKEDEKLKKWGVKINDIMLEDFLIS